MPITTVPLDASGNSAWQQDSYYLAIENTITKAQARTYLQNRGIADKFINILLGDTSECAINGKTIKFRFGVFAKYTYNTKTYWVAELDYNVMPLIGDKLIALVNAVNRVFLLDHSEIIQRMGN